MSSNVPPQDDDVIRITEDDLKNAESSLLIVTNLNFADKSTTAPAGKINWNPTEVNSVKTSVDVVLCVDTSGSMGATDYNPSRLVAAQTAAKLFAQEKVLKSYNDQIAVVGFGGNVHTKTPLTNDMNKVQHAINQLSITHSGTMIGAALHTAAELLKGAKSSHRAIILLSDGGDKFDTSQPLTIVKNFDKIIVFTIGIGTQAGSAKLPHGDQNVPLNEELLRQIAKSTGGDYVFAPDVDALQRVYAKLAHY